MATNKLETAKKLVKEGKMSQEALEILFPELKESENEKIRKVLIDIVKGACDKYGIRYHGDEITEEKLLAWLKKQGELKVIIPKFRVGDCIKLKGSDAKYQITEISDGYYRGKGWGLKIVPADESDDYELIKPNAIKWSKEDEDMEDNIFKAIQHLLKQNDSWGFLEECLDWLKSLKNRINQGIIES